MSDSEQKKGKYIDRIDFGCKPPAMTAVVVTVEPAAEKSQVSRRINPLKPQPMTPAPAQAVQTPKASARRKK